MPAEGLLGAARLAHSLRSGPPSLRSGVQRRFAALSNPPRFMSGVRTKADKRWNVILRFSDFRAGHAG